MSLNTRITGSKCYPHIPENFKGLISFDIGAGYDSAGALMQTFEGPSGEAKLNAYATAFSSNGAKLTRHNSSIRQRRATWPPRLIHKEGFVYIQAVMAGKNNIAKFRRITKKAKNHAR